MIKLTKHIAFICCVILLHIASNAQNLNDDFIKVAEKFSQSAFKMEIKMTVYHWDTSIPEVTTIGSIKRKGINYYTNFDGEINLTNTVYTLMINKNEKEIIYANHLKSSGFDNLSNQMLPDSNLFKENIKLISANSNGKVYEINKPQDGIAKMRMKISQNSILEEVVYYYTKTDDSPVKEVVITYKNVVFNPSFSINEFSEKEYFKIINGEAVATAIYKNYSLVKATSYN